MALVPLISFINSFKCLLEVVLLEISPSNVLVSLVVVFFVAQSSFIGSQSLLVFSLFFVKDTYLEQGVDLSFYREDVSED